MLDAPERSAREWAARQERQVAARRADRRTRYERCGASEAPERSLTQRREALLKANTIRSKRAQLKKDIKAGKVTIHDLLLEPPEYLLSAKVFDLMLVVPKYGRVKVNKILQLCRVSPSKTIGGLSPRQRTEIVSMLRR